MRTRCVRWTGGVALLLLVLFVALAGVRERGGAGSPGAERASPPADALAAAPAAADGSGSDPAAGPETGLPVRLHGHRGPDGVTLLMPDGRRARIWIEEPDAEPDGVRPEPGTEELGRSRLRMDLASTITLDPTPEPPQDKIAWQLRAAFAPAPGEPRPVRVFYQDGIGAAEALEAARAAGLEATDERLATEWFKPMLPAEGAWAQVLAAAGDERVFQIWPPEPPKVALRRNATSAQVANVPPIRPGGATGYNLTGTGVVLALWDGGRVRATHQELTGRVSNQNSYPFDDHATHVCGTMIASGVQAQARGMSYEATARAYTFYSNWAAEWQSQKGTFTAANNSWGYTTGFGAYQPEDASADNILRNDDTIQLIANGNSGPGSRTVSSLATAKNVISVGALTNATSLAGFSSRGPTNDFRIKPDVCARGVGVYSSVAGSDSSYDSYSGTSMATPCTTGVAGLLIQQMRTLAYGPATYQPPLALIKGLLIHTAADLGAAGPAWDTGWGRIDATAAAQYLSVDAAGGKFNTMAYGTLNSGNATVYSVTLSSTDTLRFTLVWSDPPGTPSTSPGSTTPVLVNNLELRVRKPNGTFAYPWRIDQGNITGPAQQGPNNRDNVEVIDVPSAPAGEYRISVFDDGMTGAQKFALFSRQTMTFIGTWPATLSVSPSTMFFSQGLIGGPFTPASADYTLTNTGTVSIDWEATSSVTWAVPSPTSGALAAGGSTTLTISINAASVPIGFYQGVVSVYETTTGKPNDIPVQLWVKPVTYVMDVTPATDASATGQPGGPFSPSTATYTIASQGGSTLPWTATVDVPWLTISPPSGSTPPGLTQDVQVVINAVANSLIGGTYRATITFTNNGNGFGNTTRSLWLEIKLPTPTLYVDPADGLSAIGQEGGPFDPSNKIYLLTNGGNGPLQWSAAPPEVDDWIDAYPDSGTLASLQTINVFVTLGPKAAELTNGTYNGQVEFKNTTNNQGNQSRSVTLVVSSAPRLSVSPTTSAGFGGPSGGPFQPGVAVYNLKNVGPGTLAWSANVGAAWASVAPSSGSLGSSESVNVSVSPTANAALQPQGTYTTNLNLVNTTNGLGNTGRTVTLLVTGAPALTVTPASDFTLSGPSGGPFGPAAATFTLANSGSGPMSWGVSSPVGWATANPPSGSLWAGQTANVTIVVNAAAGDLAAGLQSATLSFRNLTNAAGDTTRKVLLTINAPTGQIWSLPWSDDFETGTLSTMAWSRLPDLPASHWEGEDISPIAGTYSATFAGQPSAVGYDQALTTPALEGPAGKYITLAFTAKLDVPAQASNERLGLEVRTWPWGTWSEAWFMTGEGGTAGPIAAQVDLTGQAGQRFQLRWRARGGKSDSITLWAIDGVSATATSLPAPPAPVIENPDAAAEPEANPTGIEKIAGGKCAAGGPAPLALGLLGLLLLLLAARKAGTIR